MKILFIASGNKTFGISPITKNQHQSLLDNGADVELFLIKGKGFQGYLNSIIPLIKRIKMGDIKLIHAHYSLSGFLAVFVTPMPIVVSLMGSDIKSKNLYKNLIKFFYHFVWKKTIVKSDDLKQSLNLHNAVVIPNGVDTIKFHPFAKTDARRTLKWNINEKIILFPSDPKRREKNFVLLTSALNHINKSVQIKSMVDVPNDEVVNYYNAADVVVLPSIWEGSPNAIKEALACNRPIVATPVGDIPMLLAGVEGTFIADFSSIDLAKKIEMALLFDHSKGLDQIIKLGLSSEIVADRLIQIYKSILQE